MRITIDRETLHTELAWLRGIARPTAVLPVVVGHVLIQARDGGITLTTTDLEVGVSTRLGCRRGAWVCSGPSAVAASHCPRLAENRPDRAAL